MIKEEINIMEDKNMDTLSIFIQQNKSKIRKVAEHNMTRNKDGVVILSKNDEWRNETEWDEILEKLYYQETN